LIMIDGLLQTCMVQNLMTLLFQQPQVQFLMLFNKTFDGIRK
jgi:hypothetical protein